TRRHARLRDSSGQATFISTGAMILCRSFYLVASIMSVRAKLFPEARYQELMTLARLSGVKRPIAAADAALQFEQGGGSKQGAEIIARTGDYFRGARFDSDGWWDAGLPKG